MCDPITAITGAGAAVSGITSLVGGGISAGAATKAAQTQADAAVKVAGIQAQATQNALDFAKQQWATTQANFSPYLAGGAGGLSILQGAMPALTASQVQPISPLTLTGPPPSNLDLLKATPGYQFTLQQGLQAVTNQATAQGLGGGRGTGGVVTPSGPEGKALAQYAENLAATTYQQQFQNWVNQNVLTTQVQATEAGLTQGQSQLAQAQQRQSYNMLFGVPQLGEAAAAGQAVAGTQMAGTVGNIAQTGAAAIGQGLTGAAAAQAAGTVGSAQAITNALAGVGGAVNQTAMMLALQQSGMFGNTAGAATVPGTYPGVGVNPLALAQSQGITLG